MASGWTAMTEPLLEVRDLRVSFMAGAVAGTLVNDVSFSIKPGEVLCIVGESGCGKTVTARSIIGLNRLDPRFRLDGQIRFKGRNLLALSEREMRSVRGGEIAMIFQDPMSSLNPLQRIGTQIGEMIGAHGRLPQKAIRARVVELLRQVGIPNAESRFGDYPHQFSGGMRQRIMIALALACNPSLLIADEPTTALDVTTQKQILTLVAELIRTSGMAVVLITHDLGVVAEVADRVLVMYAGQCVEAGSVREIFRNPQHPYTAGLIASIPVANGPRQTRLASIPGSPPVLTKVQPTECPFRPRCTFAFDQCAAMPPLAQRVAEPQHLDRCWLTPEARATRLPRMASSAVN